MELNKNELSDNVIAPYFDKVKKGKDKLAKESLHQFDIEASLKVALFTKDNGFGLYDPKEVFTLLPLQPDANFDLKKTFSLLNELSFFQKIFSGKYSGPLMLFEKLNELIAKHAHYEYTNKYGKTCSLGDIFIEVEDAVCTEGMINCYPLPGVWKEFYLHEIKDFKILLQLLFILSVAGREGYNYGVYQFMDKEFTPEIIKFYGFNLNELINRLLKLPHYTSINKIIHLLADVYGNPSYKCKVSRNILASFFPLMSKRGAKKTFNGEKEEQTVFIYQHHSINYWMSDTCKKQLSDKDFTGYFTIRYNYYSKSDFPDTNQIVSFPETYLNIFDFGRAYVMGIIPESEIIKELMIRPNAQESLAWASSYLFDKLTHGQKLEFSKYENIDFSKLKEVFKKVIDRILDIELKRGDLVTEVSPLAMKLAWVEGAPVFVNILKAIGKDSFGKVDYYYTSNYTKKEVLSKLLRCCYPSETDTAETLGGLLKGTGITDKRLVQAGMYAPQWLEIIEEYLNWKGLLNTAYCLHAHVNEWCDNKRKTIISRYTPANMDDLQLGAFDIDWFREAYKEIGSKRFEILYDAAKYISSNGNYVRVRKYIDAVNGKIKAKELKEEIEKERNKDLLMSYCLIPINRRSKRDLVERYQYLQQFLRESKNFGSQRQESEKRAVEIGLQNLARNAGYTDVTRLTWSVETEIMKEIEPYFTPQEHQGVDIYVEIDDEGKSSCKYVKAGKPLTVIPNRLRKYPYMEELRRVEKKLKEQYARSQTMLEQMMEDGTTFLIRELDELTRNPIVWPLLKRLVFITDDGMTGFYGERSLITFDEETIPQEMSAEVRIAHPVDLHNQKVWKPYQAFLLEKEINQPFEQVFRKLYPKTEEEQTMQHSLRYGGNRIQQKRAIDILKSRRWVPNDEEGLQKIYYKKNIIAVIYALNDWFSPADMTAPVFEHVAFYDRKTYDPMQIKDVPDIIFSEVMYDVDRLINEACVDKVVPEKQFSPLK